MSDNNFKSIHKNLALLTVLSLLILLFMILMFF